MTLSLCTSVSHKGGERPVAVKAIIYHDAQTTGGVLNIDPNEVEPGTYGTETAFLCAACLVSPDVRGDGLKATVLREISLQQV